MNPLRLVLPAFVGCWFLFSIRLIADDGAPPFAMDKQYSADLTIQSKGGADIQAKTYVDGDKMRSEMSMEGMEMATIVRKDTQKIYQIMVSQKTVLEMPYDPSKFKGQSGATFGPDGKFELVGPDTVNGVACSKYKVTSDKNQQVFFFWLDTVHKVPVQMVAEDGSMTVKWKNYKTGPQAASLFEIPAGFQTMPMPANMPGIENSGGGTSDSGL